MSASDRYPESVEWFSAKGKAKWRRLMNVKERFEYDRRKLIETLDLAIYTVTAELQDLYNLELEMDDGR